MEETTKCAACGTKMKVSQVYSQVHLDGIYEVCSPECERDLPAIVTGALQQENFIYEKNARNYNFEDLMTGDIN